MAKCLRCGAGNEWIQGKVANEPSETQDRISALEAALREIANELGVPQSGYPAPVANAAEIARKVLEGK